MAIRIERKIVDYAVGGSDKPQEELQAPAVANDGIAAAGQRGAAA